MIPLAAGMEQFLNSFSKLGSGRLVFREECGELGSGVDAQDDHHIKRSHMEEC